MKIVIVAIAESERRFRSEAAAELASAYVARAQQYASCALEVFRDEGAFLSAVERRTGRSPATVVLLESGGKALTSEQFTAALREMRDAGQQLVMLAVGPADGWTAAARARADLRVSLGPMTLPHALAAAVLTEQVYRALTILAGHPYHCGH